MFGERFDLAILSGPLALLGLTSGRLPPSPVERFVLASPNYRAVLYCGIGVLRNPSSGVWSSACPPPGADYGRMTGGLFA
ncbi:MAG: hypothetical protein GDA36_07695 [Rhodobacteraceae bacterium]|nr:hypothetical protein [Paracoccaceae bacterium]